MIADGGPRLDRQSLNYSAKRNANEATGTPDPNACRSREFRPEQEESCAPSVLSKIRLSSLVFMP